MMFSTDFRRLLLLFATGGLAILFFTLISSLTVSSQEIRPDRTNLENIPYRSSGESRELFDRDRALLLTPVSKVVFQSLRNGHWNIYVGNDDGTGQTAVTANSNINIHPHLKRGGQVIVYASGADGNDFEIYRVNVDGGHNIPLTNNDAGDGNPQWSPDGTKILFESYRNGQAEIYVMNADGSNQTRLTHHNAFDGMPSWSPDGSKIAFSSNRSGGYRIWIMNADGSNPVQLSTQPYSLRPQWSPDGSKIAFDADSDNDNWQDLWVIDVDGSEERNIFINTDVDTDHLVSSWSPDGRYVAFTRVRYILYQGNWYWNHAYQEARDISLAWNHIVTIPMGQSDLDWYPRWQSQDAVRPVSHVASLGTTSPAHFHLNWTGTDTGGSGGISQYDVQVKNDLNSPWEDWLTGTTETSGQYLGTGNQTYYFRVRAHDRHYNIENWPSTHDAVTTVEGLPPLSYLTDLMPYTRIDNSPLITWSGHDPGNSGIVSYDVQFRVNNNAWENWFTDTLVIGSNFTLSNTISGDTLYFQTKATDFAQNEEEWPAYDDASQTTLYNWGIQGTAFDNTGTPVTEVTVDTNPVAVDTIAEDIDGDYSAYVTVDVPSYQASWHKNDYQSLPNTTFAMGLDTNQNIWLPPANNLVANWGFEDGISQTDWHLSGNVSSIITETAKHTGDFGVLLGNQNYEFSATEVITTVVNNTLIAIDADNTVHLLWFAGGQLYYKYRPISGDWSQSQNLLGNVWGSLNDELIVDDFGNLHIAVSTGEHDIYYLNRAHETGHWSVTNVSQDSYWSRYPNLATDKTGKAHIVWQSARPGYYYSNVFYSHQLEDGTFSTPLWLEDSHGYSINPRILVDGNNHIHISWQSKGIYNDEIIMYASNAQGVWKWAQEITGEIDLLYFNEFAVADDGTVHFVWRGKSNDVTTTNYRYINVQGVMSDSQTLVEAISYPQIKVDAVGTLHMVWVDNDSIHYMQKGKHTGWRPAETLALSPATPNISFDRLGQVHLIWGGGYYSSNPNSDVYHMKKLGDGPWTLPTNLSIGENDPTTPSMALDSAGGVHIAWKDDFSSDNTRPNEIHYRGPYKIDTNGNSTITHQLTIPVTMTSPTLSVLYQMGGVYPQLDSYLSVEVDDSNIKSEVLAINDSSSGWQHAWADLTPWLGQTISVTVALHQAANAPRAWVNVDEISIGTTYPDVWVDIDDGNAALGQEVDQIISYGNRGGTVANGVVLTYTLPTGLTFISATVPPESTEPLVWQLSAQQAKGEPNEIVVTAQVNTNADSFTNLTSTAVISIDNNELELLNNEAEGVIYTADYIYLPIVFR